jgi:hypothetical protein
MSTVLAALRIEVAVKTKIVILPLRYYYAAFVATCWPKLPRSAAFLRRPPRRCTQPPAHQPLSPSLSE